MAETEAESWFAGRTGKRIMVFFASSTGETGDVRKTSGQITFVSARGIVLDHGTWINIAHIAYAEDAI